jgi:phosphoribosylaminoimidazolecarboxamide formyltransferase/IMP cyclohydrolase
MARIRRALVSVSDKHGLVDFAKTLHRHGVELLSTGGTAKLLADAGIPVTQVGDYTGFPEMMDGRVKTLHPKIHGGLLGRRDLPEHMAAMKTHGIEPIDLVVVNLYPFAATIAKPGVTFEEAIENIDIGGPSMLRSAAKNHESVTVIVDPADYAPVAEEMDRTGGDVSVATNRRLAQKVFHTTAVYDGMIADYLGASAESRFGRSFHTAGTKAIDMRYGENPHQGAALYGDFLGIAEPLHGRELSYNNVVDIDAAMALALEFDADPEPAIAILKHNTPCGVGQGRDAVEAWDRAFATDPESPFGGIIICTKPWTMALAQKVDELFTEVLIAPSFEPDAFAFLQKKRNRRLVRWHPDRMSRTASVVRGVASGLLVQDADRPAGEFDTAKVVTTRQPTDAERVALRFAWKVVKHVKSNAIVFAGAAQTLAVGGGQTSRVEAIRNAVARAAREKIDLKGSVLASDAFFPFPDGLEEAVAAGATAVVQPGGSNRDAEVIKAADARGIAMLFTGVRHFRH